MPRQMVLKYDDTIGQDVVGDLGAHRSGVTEVAHLNRRMTAHKYFWTGIVGESFQVHGDVDFQVSKEPRYFAIALMANVDKSVKGAPQTRSHFAAVVGTERNGDRFEPASVMSFKPPRRQLPGCVIPEIRRKIG